MAGDTQDGFQEALRAISDMIERSKKAQMKFPAGTSQHSLQKDR